MTGRRDRRDHLGGDAVVGGAAVLLGRGARVDAERGGARILEALGGLGGRARTGSRPRRIFTVTGMSTARTIASTIARRRPGRQERGARARLADLRDGAAHVDVNQVGAASSTARAASAIASASAPKTCTATGCSPGRCVSIPMRLAVGVADAEARDHLRHRQPGPVAAGLAPERPVGDAGEGRLHQAVLQRSPPTSHDSATGVGRGARPPPRRAGRAPASTACMRFFTATSPVEAGLRDVELVDHAQALQREQRVDLVDLLRVAGDTSGARPPVATTTRPRRAPPDAGAAPSTIADRAVDEARARLSDGRTCRSRAVGATGRPSPGARPGRRGRRGRSRCRGRWRRPGTRRWPRPRRSVVAVPKSTTMHGPPCARRRRRPR